MARVKTYILAPNFTYKPSGPIQIGNIITDPLRPTKVLSSLSTDSQPAIEVITQHEFELVDEQDRSIHAGVWSTFLETIGASLGAGHETNRSHTYKATELETHYLRDEPSETDVARRTAEPSVQAVIRAGWFGARPVYMVTGVKVARGFAVSNGMNKSWTTSSTELSQPQKVLA
ncbi:uncharacterized protein F4807DRAFT_407145 [Annulohypoxylon truncatum]|uniref:uncharacterized protein n=1 Tax=Annulohypoxylon truncatum TaxID=327061 RepID=UPI002007A5B2|nr:uncharacterized protein F4807DRAFT_407145 [Annulohypoxylon truncatum]KAI1214235.1 hypothetical protein F4807DRAFT_407145 [Annulohypoxylon truncatum]